MRRRRLQRRPSTDDAGTVDGILHVPGSTPLCGALPQHDVLGVSLTPFNSLTPLALNAPSPSRYACDERRNILIGSLIGSSSYPLVLLAPT